MVDEAGGAHQEAIKTAFFVEFFNSVEDSAHHVMSAGSLPSGKNYADIEGFFHTCGVLIFDELHNRHTICMGEQFFDFLLISH